MTTRTPLILLLLLALACTTSPRKPVIGRVYIDGQRTRVIRHPQKGGTFIYYYWADSNTWVPYPNGYTPSLLTPTDTYIEETPTGFGADVIAPPPDATTIDATTAWTDDIGSDVDGGFDGAVDSGGFGGADSSSGGDAGGGGDGGGGGGD